MNQFWVRELPSGTCESGGGIPAPGQRGFTILELMIVVTIVGILIAVAVPSFTDLIRATRQRSALSSVSDAVITARVEAVTRGLQVTACATSNPEAADPDCAGTNGWESGIVVLDASGVIQVWGPAPSGVTVRALGFAAQDEVVFNPDGTIPAAGTFVVCDSRGAAEAIGVVTSVAGLSRPAIDDDGSGTIIDAHNGSNVTCP